MKLVLFKTARVREHINKRAFDNFGSISLKQKGWLSGVNSDDALLATKFKANEDMYI